MSTSAGVEAAPDRGSKWKSRRRRIAKVLGWGLIIAAIVGFGFLPGWVERIVNRSGDERTPVSAAAQALHGRILVADLHADSLLWDRDLATRSGRGHVDIVRLREGGVGLQIFTVVSKVPVGLNIERNPSDSDMLGPLMFFQLTPPAVWSDLTARAMYQAGRLEVLAKGDDAIVFIRTATDLAEFQRRRAQDPAVIGVVLGAEGAHPLQGDLGTLDAMFDAGFRMIGLTHFFDNEVGGSAHGEAKGPLTPFGAKVVDRMQTLGIAVDLAHASPKLFDDVLARSKRPLIVSHTGVRGTCNNGRNLSDRQLRGIASTGGVVGIGYWSTAVCGTSTAAIVRAIRHAVKVAGVDHVGLGSDFDGAVKPPFDTTGVPQITAGLLDAGLSEDDIAKIMGGNAARVLAETLPP